MTLNTNTCDETDHIEVESKANSLSKNLQRMTTPFHITMASNIQAPTVVDPDVDSNSDSSDTTDEPTFEGCGTETMICPRIRKSHCNFYAWDKSTDKHIERPCPFTFISEKAYQRHIFEMHSFDYDWMKNWYAIGKKCRPAEAEVGGRLPRYPPSEEGPSVIDRKAREDPKKMIRRLNLLYSP